MVASSSSPASQASTLRMGEQTPERRLRKSLESLTLKSPSPKKRAFSEVSPMKVQAEGSTRVKAKGSTPMKPRAKPCLKRPAASNQKGCKVAAMNHHGKKPASKVAAAMKVMKAEAVCKKPAASKKMAPKAKAKAKASSMKVRTVAKSMKQAKNSYGRSLVDQKKHENDFQLALDEAWMEWNDARCYNASYGCPPPCTWKQQWAPALEEMGWVRVRPHQLPRANDWIYAPRK